MTIPKHRQQMPARRAAGMPVTDQRPPKVLESDPDPEPKGDKNTVPEKPAVFKTSAGRGGHTQATRKPKEG